MQLYDSEIIFQLTLYLPNVQELLTIIKAILCFIVYVVYIRILHLHEYVSTALISLQRVSMEVIYYVTKFKKTIDLCTIILLW